MIPDVINTSCQMSSLSRTDSLQTSEDGMCVWVCEGPEADGAAGPDIEGVVLTQLVSKSLWLGSSPHLHVEARSREHRLRGMLFQIPARLTKGIVKGSRAFDELM